MMLKLRLLKLLRRIKMYIERLLITFLSDPGRKKKKKEEKKKKKKRRDGEAAQYRLLRDSVREMKMDVAAE